MQRDDIFLASPSLASQALLHPVPAPAARPRLTPLPREQDGQDGLQGSHSLLTPEPWAWPSHPTQPIVIRDGTRAGWVKPAAGWWHPLPHEPQKAPWQCRGVWGTHQSRGARHGEDQPWQLLSNVPQ